MQKLEYDFYNKLKLKISIPNKQVPKSIKEHLFWKQLMGLNIITEVSKGRGSVFSIEGNEERFNRLMGDNLGDGSTLIIAN